MCSKALRVVNSHLIHFGDRRQNFHCPPDKNDLIFASNGNKFTEWLCMLMWMVELLIFDVTDLHCHLWCRSRSRINRHGQIADPITKTI